jgi:hypothetical protein
MPTECSAKPMGFARVDGRCVVADFEGGAITSNAGGLLLGATDRAIGLVERFAACFSDGRSAERVVHDIATLVGQRVFGIALGYEDLVDHDRLRHDPVLGVVLGRLEARHGRCAALAGKSTLNRLEHGAAAADRYRRIAHDGAAIEALFVDLFLDATIARRRRSCSTSTPPTIRSTGIRRGGSSTATTTATATCRSTSSAAATCLAAKLRRSNIDASAGRGRGGGAHRRADPRPLAAGADRAARRRRLRAGCADGLVRGEPRRLPVRPRPQRPPGRADPRRTRLGRARRRASGRPARRFADFRWTTRDSWSRRRRVVAKAEWMPGRGDKGANPRFVVTSLKAARADGFGRRVDRSACHCAVVARCSRPPPRVAALRRSSREIVEGTRLSRRATSRTQCRRRREARCPPARRTTGADRMAVSPISVPSRQ